MEKILIELAVAVPSAAAVIVVVILFLKHQRSERESRDAAQAAFLSAMTSLSKPIHELSTEVRMLRDHCAAINK
jgi:hypothetical protein